MSMANPDTSCDTRMRYAVPATYEKKPPRCASVWRAGQPGAVGTKRSEKVACCEARWKKGVGTGGDTEVWKGRTDRQKNQLHVARNAVNAADRRSTSPRNEPGNEQ